MAKSGFASFIGRPNAGKSTLLNQIIGTKIAIVSDKPQTTRNRILGVKNFDEGQLILLDTPGIHRPLHRMNVRMVDVALDSIGQVDVLALVVDATGRPGQGDRFVVGLLEGVQIPVVLVLNKIDLIAKPRLLPLIEWYRQQWDFTQVVPTSALTGDGVDTLERAILASLPEGPPLYPDDFLTDQPERALAAELVREQLLRCTHTEIPFSSTVVVERFEETDARGILRIYASVVVERDSQKRIVIGRGGEMIKRIGTAARLEIERLFGTRIFLDLHVKVRSAWRENERMLDTLGVPRRRS